MAGAPQPTTHQNMFVRLLLRSKFEAGIALQYDWVNHTEFLSFKDEFEFRRTEKFALETQQTT